MWESRYSKTPGYHQVIYACTMYDGDDMYVCMHVQIHTTSVHGSKTLEREKLNSGILYSGIHSIVGSDGIIFVDSQ